jgi:DNA modification methylase
MATDPTKGKLLVGDCLETLKTLPDNSIDSIVTDPPYGIEFMGKEWDSFKAKKDDEQPGTASGQTKTWCSSESSGIGIQAPRFGTQTRSDQLAFQEWYEQVARECLRVLKPGGHFLSFGATRMYHRMAVAIEDAGFEIRDSIHWTYGSGFPKSHNVSIAIDKAAGVMKHRGKRMSNVGQRLQGEDIPTAVAMPAHEPITDAAKKFTGWGTALKPSHEPIVVARKPLDGTVADNVQQHGTGAINIDATRIGTEAVITAPRGKRAGTNLAGGSFGGNSGGYNYSDSFDPITNTGRFPANTLLTHNHDCQQTGTRSDDITLNGDGNDKLFHGDFNGGHDQTPKSATVATWSCTPNCPIELLDQQQAEVSRFFHNSQWSVADDLTPFIYQAKPGKKERNAGLEALPEKTNKFGNQRNGEDLGNGSVNDKFTTEPSKNFHPTVKPVELMRYLIKMVTPPNGVVLDPFLGSGTTAVAATLEGYAWKGCELTADYLPIIKGRVTWAVAEKKKQDKKAKQLTLEEQQ